MLFSSKAIVVVFFDYLFTDVFFSFVCLFCLVIVFLFIYLFFFCFASRFVPGQEIQGDYES